MRPIASAVMRGTMVSSAASASSATSLPLASAASSDIATATTTPSILSTILSYLTDHKWAMFGIGLAATPIIALLQGTYFLIRYRLQFGSEVPVPVLPAHGVVLVVDREEEEETDASGKSQCSRNVDITYRDESDSSTDADANENKMRIWGSIAAATPPSSRPNTKQAPLRLLVIGDSLAAGVGVLSPSSPVPLLPEIVARSLSRAFGGKPIFWTCVAEPGASSGWIVKELASRSFLQDDQHDQDCKQSVQIDGGEANGFAYETKGSTAPKLPPASSSVMQKALALSAGGDTIISNIDEADRELAEWCRMLQVHSKRLHTDVVGEYDVAVVMTGLNDLKGAILPFLLTGDEIEFRRQAHARGGDYTAELKRVVDALSDKMKKGFTEYVQNARLRVGSMTSSRKETIATSADADEMQQSESSRHPLLPTDELSSTQYGAADECAEDKKGQSVESKGGGEQYPLVVLTALPSNLPVLQCPPFIWLLKPLLRWTDRIKRKLAWRFPHAMLFVEAPKRSEMKNYELKRGPFWLEHEKEKILLSLKVAPEGECRRTEDAMHSYHDKHNRIRQRIHGRDCAPSCEEDDFGNLFDGKDETIFPANVHPRAPGASLLSADGIHPNNLGYDCWGRMIAGEILKKWYS